MSGFIQANLKPMRTNTVQPLQQALSGVGQMLSSRQDREDRLAKQQADDAFRRKQQSDTAAYRAQQQQFQQDSFNYGKRKEQEAKDEFKSITSLNPADSTTILTPQQEMAQLKVSKGYDTLYNEFTKANPNATAEQTEAALSPYIDKLSTKGFGEQSVVDKLSTDTPQARYEANLLAKYDAQRTAAAKAGNASALNFVEAGLGNDATKMQASKAAATSAKTKTLRDAFDKESSLLSKTVGAVSTGGKGTGNTGVNGVMGEEAAIMADSDFWFGQNDRAKNLVTAMAANGFSAEDQLAQLNIAKDQGFWSDEIKDDFLKRQPLAVQKTFANLSKGETLEKMANRGDFKKYKYKNGKAAYENAKKAQQVLTEQLDKDLAAVSAPTDRFRDTSVAADKMLQYTGGAPKKISEAVVVNDRPAVVAPKPVTPAKYVFNDKFKGLTVDTTKPNFTVDTYYSKTPVDRTVTTPSSGDVTGTKVGEVQTSKFNENPITSKRFGSGSLRDVLLPTDTFADNIAKLESSSKDVAANKWHKDTKGITTSPLGLVVDKSKAPDITKRNTDIAKSIGVTLDKNTSISDQKKVVDAIAKDLKVKAATDSDVFKDLSANAQDVVVDRLYNAGGSWPKATEALAAMENDPSDANKIAVIQELRTKTGDKYSKGLDNRVAKKLIDSGLFTREDIKRLHSKLPLQDVVA